MYKNALHCLFCHLTFVDEGLHQIGNNEVAKGKYCVMMVGRNSDPSVTAVFPTAGRMKLMIGIVW